MKKGKIGKITKKLLSNPYIRKTGVSALLLAMLLNGTACEIVKTDNPVVRIDEPLSNSFDNKATDEPIAPVETLEETATPTATAEPVPTEEIKSEVPENVHPDEQNQTVTIDYDTGSITYEGAKYIGVSYVDQYYNVDKGDFGELPSIILVYEDYTLEYPRDRYGDYTFVQIIDGIKEEETILYRDTYIYRKVRYYIETENGLIIDTEKKSLIKLENGKIIPDYYNDRKYSNDKIKEENLAMTIKDTSILLKDYEANIDEFPFGPEEYLMYTMDNPSVEDVQRMLNGFKEYLFAETITVDLAVKMEDFSKIYYETPSEYGATKIIVEKYDETEGGFEYNQPLCMMLAIYNGYPGLSEKDMYDLMELERLKTNVLVANASDDPEARSQAWEEYINGLTRENQVSMNTYLSTLNISQVISNSNSGYQELTINGITTTSARLTTYLKQYNGYLRNYIISTNSNSKLSKTLGEISKMFDRAKVPKLEDYALKVTFGDKIKLYANSVINNISANVSKTIEDIKIKREKVATEKRYVKMRAKAHEKNETTQEKTHELHNRTKDQDVKHVSVGDLDFYVEKEIVEENIKYQTKNNIYGGLPAKDVVNTYGNKGFGGRAA